MPSANRLSIQIYGNKYPITTAEAPKYVQELAEEMDQTIRDVVEGSRASLTEALILTCLSYLDAYKKAEINSDNLRSQIAEYLEEAAKARLEASEARREITRLENRLQSKKDEN